MILRVALAAVVLAASPPAFHYERVVAPPMKDADAPEICVPLPADLLAHAAPELQDVRLYAGSREVPYELRVSRNTSVEAALPQRILNLGERGGEVTFDVEMTEPRYDQVLLRILRSHFSVLVRITGASTAGASGVTFPAVAFSGNGEDEEPQERIIPLPESSFRYLHFEIKSLALAPVTPPDIGGVSVLRGGEAPARYLLVSVADAPRQEERQTIYEFAVPANAPVERLTLQSDDANAVFARTAGLERYRTGTAGTEDTVPVQSEGISLARTALAKRQKSATDVGAIPLALDAVPYASTVRLTIQNGDDSPLALHDVTLQMRERQLCFLRRPGESYVLRYGDPALAPPRYDRSPIAAAAANATVGLLDAERVLTPTAGAVSKPFTERHPILMWIALLAAVATLGWVALRSARSS